MFKEGSVTVDQVAAATEQLVTATNHLVTVTGILVVATFLAIVLPIAESTIRGSVIQREERKRARAVVETITLVLESKLKAIVDADRRVALVGGTEVLVNRIFDPAITKHLTRGTFDLLIHAVSTAFGVLEQARVEMPEIERRHLTYTAVESILDSMNEEGRVKMDRASVALLKDSATACIIMLRRVRSRIKSNSTDPFIDWEREYAQLASEDEA